MNASLCYFLSWNLALIIIYFPDGPTVLVGGGFSMGGLCLVALGCYSDVFAIRSLASVVYSVIHQLMPLFL